MATKFLLFKTSKDYENPHGLPSLRVPIFNGFVHLLYIYIRILQGCS
jgi:hypothetical protein